MEKQMIADCGVLAGRWPLDPEKPTLVFIHGAALSKGLWTGQVRGLADAANTLAVDLPGHKDSAGPGHDNIEAHAEAVYRVIEAAAAPRPIPCGLSMGGAVAQALLISRPEAFSAGILMHTGARLRVVPFIFEVIEKDFQQLQEIIANFALSSKADKERAKKILADISEPSKGVAANDFMACDAFDAMDRISRIRVPVLVVTGDEDNLTPPKYGAYLAQNIPGAKLVGLQGVGHLSPIEKPEAVNQVIRDFLADL